MDRIAVFVDAGYLFAAGSEVVCGSKSSRGSVRLDHEAVIRKIVRLSEEISGLPLLRVYWYDGTADGPSSEHLALAYRDQVKVRLGMVNSVGQQKGVDSLIITDMINLARNRAMVSALLLSGDEDLRVGVQQAQEWGVLVHLLGIRTERDNQSALLKQEADSTHVWSADDVCEFLTRRVVEPKERADSVLPGREIERTFDAGAIAEEVLGDLDEERIDAILALSTPRTVPRDVDARLLSAGSRHTGESLSASQKRELRAAFFAACRTRTESSE